MNLKKLNLNQKEYIENSIQFIKYDMDKHVKNLVEYRNNNSVEDINLLSENIHSSKIPKYLIESITITNENMHKYIYACASMIEQDNYPNYKEYINEMDVAYNKKKMFIEFVSSLKEFSYSLKVLDLLFYVGVFVNNIVSERLKNGNYEYSLLSDLKVNSLNIANCFFIYELAYFMSSSLKNIQILGQKNITDTIDKNLEKLSQSKLDNKKRIDKSNVKQILTHIENSEKRLLKLKEDFNIINEKINQAQNKYEEIKKIEHDAKIQIQTLDAITFSSFLEGSLGIFNSFSFLEQFEMPDILLEDLPLLLGVE